ncbi:hypothetical protein [Kitasatospora sp. NPDC056181]|uniref:hypothetical protein n=1 Tax=Kitasatospora sp. NPDC056181 TaxID=3345737 RepID=UPI0035DE7F39
MAALLTAGANPPAWIKWFAGIHGAIAVGVLLVATAQAYTVTLVAAYGNRIAHPNWVKGAGHVLLGVAIAGGVVGAVLV